MLVPLELQEIMHRAHRRGIPCDDAHLTAAGQRVEDVADRRLLGGHDAGARNGLVMDESGRLEIAGAEGLCDAFQVVADGAHTGSISRIPDQHDAAAVGGGLEAVEGRVLVHAHRDLAALLHRVEGGVLGAERARGQETEQEGTDALDRQFKYRLHTAMIPPQVIG